MTVSAESKERIDDYLKALRSCLRDLNDDDAREIVEEIRSHLLDEARDDPAAVAFTIAALGTPEEHASRYLADDLLSRAQVSRSPWLMLHSFFRWATLSFAGFWILLFSLVGYFLAAAFSLCALLKPIHPETAGLWLLADGPDHSVSLRLGFGSIPPGGRELLGWWIVPLGLVVATGLALLTFRSGLWSIRNFWQRPAQVGRSISGRTP